MTPEEIAREAAGALCDDETLAAMLAEGPRGRALPLVYSHFLAAVNRALREVPIPGAMSAERLAGVSEWLKQPEAPEDVPLRETVRDLLADNAHLRRALHDCGQDGSFAQWSAGYKAGYEAAQKRAQEIYASMDAWDRDNVIDLFEAAGM